MSKAKSPASCKLWSTVYAKSISPKEVDSTSDTVGFGFDPKTAVEVATMLLSMALDREAKGDIVMTGRKSDLSVSVLRREEGDYEPLCRKPRQGNGNG